MAIETLDDIVEQLANEAGVWGAHEENGPIEDECRVCYTSALTRRIREAVRIERLVNGEFPSS
jgi:hypothetical protein